MDAPTWGDAILAGTAIAAAGIAAWTANHRMGRQLAHDRRLSEKEELRSTLDDICKAVALTQQLVFDFAPHRDAQLPETYDPAKASDVLRMTAWNERQDAWQKGLSATEALLAQIQRIRLRFKDDHPATRKLVEMRGALLDELGDQPRNHDLEAIASDFVDACRPYVAAEDPTAPRSILARLSGG